MGVYAVPLSVSHFCLGNGRLCAAWPDARAPREAGYFFPSFARICASTSWTVSFEEVAEPAARPVT